jgi:hypothetical protein
MNIFGKTLLLTSEIYSLLDKKYFISSKEDNNITTMNMDPEYYKKVREFEEMRVKLMTFLKENFPELSVHYNKDSNEIK